MSFLDVVSGRNYRYVKAVTDVRNDIVPRINSAVKKLASEHPLSPECQLTTRDLLYAYWFNGIATFDAVVADNQSPYRTKIMDIGAAGLCITMSNIHMADSFTRMYGADQRDETTLMALYDLQARGCCYMYGRDIVFYRDWLRSYSTFIEEGRNVNISIIRKMYDSFSQFVGDPTRLMQEMMEWKQNVSIIGVLAHESVGKPEWPSLVTREIATH